MVFIIIHVKALLVDLLRNFKRSVECINKEKNKNTVVVVPRKEISIFFMVPFDLTSLKMLPVKL